MKMHLTGFKASTTIKPSINTEIELGDLKTTLQNVCDAIPQNPQQIPTFWSMNEYNPAGKHDNQSIRELSGIILEYELRYANDLVTGLKDMPWHYLLVETERKGSQHISLFFPLGFRPDVNSSMRIAGVLAYMLGVYGLSKGSGTPTFLVKLAGGQQISEHPGVLLDATFIRDTNDIGDASKTALDDFQGQKPHQKLKTVADPVIRPTSTDMARQGKEQQIAAQFRLIADLFDPA